MRELRDISSLIERSNLSKEQKEELSNICSIGVNIFLDKVFLKISGFFKGFGFDVIRLFNLAFIYLTYRKLVESVFLFIASGILLSKFENILAFPVFVIILGLSAYLYRLLIRYLKGRDVKLLLILTSSTIAIFFSLFLFSLKRF